MVFLFFFSTPGSFSDRKTMRGELNWIFTAVTDTIAWDVLPKGEYELNLEFLKDSKKICR